MLHALTRSALIVLFGATLQAQAVPGPAVPAPTPDPLHQTGQNVTVSLLTMGSGDQVWEMFGHTAIWIHDNYLDLITQRLRLVIQTRPWEAQ